MIILMIIRAMIQNVSRVTIPALVAEVLTKLNVLNASLDISESIKTPKALSVYFRITQMVLNLNHSLPNLNK